MRSPKLPQEHWNKTTLLKISAKAGRPLVVDKQTESISKGCFARVCVQIGISKPLILGTGIDEGTTGFRQLFVYENIPILCFGCGRVGHSENCCPFVNTQSSKEVESASPIGGLSEGIVNSCSTHKCP